MTAPIAVRLHPHASHDTLTLNLPERQVLVEFPRDPNMMWHHRLLLIRVRGSLWIVATPTREVEQVDLSQYRVLPVERHAHFPLDGRPYFCFGQLSDLEVDQLRSRAGSLADVLGLEPSGASLSTDASVGVWRFADPAHPWFGQAINPTAMSSAATCETRAGAALVRVDAGDGIGPCWTFGERVLERDVSQWNGEKRCGAGRDPRLLPTSSSGVKVLFRDAVVSTESSLPITSLPTVNPGSSLASDALRRCPVSHPMMFEGSSVLRELNEAILSSGSEIGPFYQNWLKHSGVNEFSNIAYEVGHDLHGLHLMYSVDGLDGGRLATAEHFA